MAENLNAIVTETAAVVDSSMHVNSTNEAINELLVITSTVFILQMQLGFALLETGLVRSKNSKNILIKNMFDTCAGALAFWLVGFGWAFSHRDGSKNGFIDIDSAMFASKGFDAEEKNYYL